MRGIDRNGRSGARGNFPDTTESCVPLQIDVFVVVIGCGFDEFRRLDAALVPQNLYPRLTKGPVTDRDVSSCSSVNLS